MNIVEILSLEDQKATIEALKEKQFNPPKWSDLVKEYDPTKHPVMNKERYPDTIADDGTVISSSRVTYALQKLAVDRTSEITFGLPAKRNYHLDEESEKQTAVRDMIESILHSARIDTLNLERSRLFYASCEFSTLWYAVEGEVKYGDTKFRQKLRTRTFSPMQGEEIYPLFDESGDLVALSIESKSKDSKTTYLDTYTADQHIQWVTSGQVTERTIDEALENLKIPLVYLVRPLPIWEHTSPIVYEMEWTSSRNGNYIQHNAKPLLGVFADHQIEYGDNPEASDPNKGLGIMQFPSGSRLEYITWQQATESIKFHVDQLRENFFTTLQLPDWSYSNMKTTPMSGEARKQLFLDAHLKARRESGAWVECLEREINIIKSFLKLWLPSEWHSDIDAVTVDYEIQPFAISEERDKIQNIALAKSAGMLSTVEAVKRLGWVRDIDQEIEQLSEAENALHQYD